MQLDLFVGHFVLLSDDATTNLKSLSVSHSLVFSDSVQQNMKPAQGSDILILHDLVTVVKDQNLVASNALTFITDAQPRVSVLNVGHSLLLWQLMKIEPGAATDALVLSHSVVATPSKGTNNTLVLSHAVTIESITRSFSIEDTLGLAQAVNVYMPLRGFSVFTTPVPALQDVHFYLAGVVDETFRPPLFGNTDELTFQRVNRRSRGGDLLIFRDNEWPMTETFQLHFDFPCQSDADRLLLVIRKTIGRYVQYTDHEGTSWFGVIKNPDTPRVQSGRNTFTVEVSMEVEKVATHSADIGHALNFTQAAESTSPNRNSLILAQSVDVVLIPA